MWNGHWNAMGWNGGMWPWFMGFHGILWILFLTLIVFALVCLIRDRRNNPARDTASAGPASRRVSMAMNTPNSDAPSRGSSARVQVSVEQSFDAAEAAWRFLETNADTTLFQTWKWQKTWFDTVGSARGDRPAIVVLRDADDTPLGLLPLAIRRRRGYREAFWLAEPFLDYGMPILSRSFHKKCSGAALDTLWQRIVHSVPADVVRLDKMPARVGSAVNPLCDALPVVEADIAWHCDLVDHTDLESLQKAHRTAKSLSTERRKARRMREIGPVRIAAPRTLEDAEGVIDALIAQKGAHLRSRGIDSIHDDANYRDFMLHLWQNADPELRIDLRALWVGDEVAAAHWGAIHGDRYYFLQPSRHLGHLSRFSPGNELLNELLSHSLAERLSVFDFGLGDESYKQNYATGSVMLYRHTEACSVVGRLALDAASAARTARQWGRQLKTLLNGTPGPKSVPDGSTAYESSPRNAGPSEPTASTARTG